MGPPPMPLGLPMDIIPASMLLKSPAPGPELGPEPDEGELLVNCWLI